MSCDHACQFDPMEVAYAIIHVQHLGKPLSDPERLECGYCNRDHRGTGDEWDEAYKAQREVRS